MEAELKTQIAFHLTGKKSGAELAAVADADARPALLAGYRDLTTLRYDFPLVLLRDANDKAYVQCLSAIVDNVAHATAKDDDGDRLTRHLLRLEQEIRVLLGSGARGELSALWDDAVSRLGARGDDAFRDSLKRGRAALKVDGQLADCDKTMPARLLCQAWTVAQDRKIRKFNADLTRLIIRLSDILTVDVAHSAAGRSAASLKAAIGTGHADVFDFEALSQVLGKASARDNLPVGRRRRIESLLTVLKAQRFFPTPDKGDDPAAQNRCYSFMFDSCSAALAAYRERLPKAIELAKSMAIAELEVNGEYREATHGAFFQDFSDSDLGQGELSRFPNYLIAMTADKLHAAESDTFMEMLSAGLPAKVLVQTDDLLAESPTGGDGHFALGMRGKQLANMAIGLNDVYVLQSAGSNLFQFRDRILKGMSYTGPALFSVYSGASGDTGTLPPYLNAAAAMESRAFPAYCYDPSAGPNWASRFHLEANSQIEADWPVQDFTYEDDNHQRVQTRTGFTFIDFVACDRRYARHFARVPRAKWNASMIPAGEYLGLAAGSAPDKVPFVTLVDRDNTLYRAIVDDRLMRAALRCRESWHSLQELGGIHNSHAERLLAREKKGWEEHEKNELAARAPEAKPAAPVAAANPVAPAVAAEPEEKKSPDEAYIETPRCTTCNECTQLNDKMFAYNEDKQAYIANPDAGTYAQLVEAAESCQVSIIHPGKPRNPAEPGIAELLERAEAFR
ncbi:MAG: ferredoxin [Burkholderiales bacterium]|nr:ferredoxin [Burkholderiales bacterium]